MLSCRLQQPSIYRSLWCRLWSGCSLCDFAEVTSDRNENEDGDWIARHCTKVWPPDRCRHADTIVGVHIASITRHYSLVPTCLDPGFNCKLCPSRWTTRPMSG